MGGIALKGQADLMVPLEVLVQQTNARKENKKGTVVVFGAKHDFKTMHCRER